MKEKQIDQSNENSNPLKVVSIIGSGRSGSTLLGMVIEAAPNTIHCGEISKLAEVVMNEKEYCSCGEKANRCGFWSEVIGKWKQKTAQQEINAIITLQKAFTRIRRLGFICLSQVLKNADLQRYRKYEHQIYHAIKDVSSADCVVDSSKNPVRAWLLSSLPRTDHKIIHLVKSPVGVAESMNKPFEMDSKAGITQKLEPVPLGLTVLKWIATNLLCECVHLFLGRKRVYRLKYEFLMAEPSKALTELELFLGVDLSDAKEKILLKEPFESKHIIAGNRIRMNREVKVNTEYTLRTQAHNWPQGARLVLCLASPLTRRYGY